MDDGLCFNEKLIFKLSDEIDSKEIALSFLAEQLYAKKYVTEGYKKGILDREKIYPTGLFTGGINIAVPHTDCIHVRCDAFAMGILSKPLAFYAMDDPEREMDVNIIFMLALSQPHGQIAMLQKVLALVKEQEQLKQMINCKDVKTIYNICLKYLIRGDE